MKRLKFYSQRGDTIVEVLIAMAILAIVLGTAFVSSSHSLQNGVDAGNRNRALGYAQEQIEFIKAVTYKTPADAKFYRLPTPFCISYNDTTTALPASDGKCLHYKDPNSQYSIQINYDSTSQVSTITANWSATNGSGQDKLELYYKMPR